MKTKRVLIVICGLLALIEHGLLLWHALMAYLFHLTNRSDMPMELWDIVIFGGIAIVSFIAAFVMRIVLFKLKDPTRAWLWTLMATAVAPLTAWFFLEGPLNSSFFMLFAGGPLGVVLTYVMFTMMSRASKKQDPQNALSSREWQCILLPIFLIGLPCGWLLAKPHLERTNNPPNFVLEDNKLPRNSIYNFAAFSPNGQLLATSSGISDQPGGVQVWETQNGKLSWSKPFPFAVYSLAFTRNGKIIVAQCYDDFVRKFDAQNGRVLSSFKIKECNQLMLSKDDTLVVKDGPSVHLYDLKSGKLKKQSRLPGVKPDEYGSYDFINEVSSDKKLVATPLDKGIVVWDFQTRKTRRILSGHTTKSADGMSWMTVDVDFSPDGKLIAVSGGKLKNPKSHQTVGTVRLWDTRTWKPLPSLTQSEWVYPVIFSGDGKWLCVQSGTQDGRFVEDVWIWDTKKWTVKRKIHAGMPVAFSTNGKMLVTDERDTRGGAFYSLWKLDK